MTRPVGSKHSSTTYVNLVGAVETAMEVSVTSLTVIDWEVDFPPYEIVTEVLLVVKDVDVEGEKVNSLVWLAYV